MIIGVDFDNTIISYDALFHRLALERALIPAGLPVNKTAVRNHLRATGREEIWTELQGEVYGARLAEAEPYPGVKEFFRECRQLGVPLVIVSHKTRHPYRGARHDLHAAARGWLRQHGFFAADGAGLAEDAVFFELTKADKLARMAAAGCSHFIDDLPELLTDPAFPAGVERFLFDAQAMHGSESGVRHVANWAELRQALLAPKTRPQALARILSPCGCSGPEETLAGGANNRVSRLATDHGGSVIVKSYFRRPGDPRNRFAAEQAFYRYAAEAGVTQIPRALGWDEAEQLGVFTFVAGHRPATAEPPHYEAALRFLAALNRARTTPAASALPPAAEACFSIAAHLAAVRRRIATLSELSALSAGDALDAAAMSFVNEILRPAWRAIEAEVNRSGDEPWLARELAPAERCVSPSDFGFHNSIESADGRVTFFDFEYAGWDDPAKLVADFFCQPEVPADHAQFEPFLAHLGGLLALDDQPAFAERCRILLPVYQVKWAGILLNEFTPLGRSRREFSLGPATAAARRARQLARARAMLDGLRIAA